MAQAAQRRAFYGWIILIAAFLGYGLMIGFLTYAPPVAMTEMIVAKGWARAEATAPITVQTWLYIVLYPLLGWAVNRYGGRAVIAIGLFGLAALFLLITQVTELWQWFIARGVLWALVAIMAGILPFQTIVTQWFNLRRGFAIGAMFLGGGVFGFASPPLISVVMEATKSWQVGWGVGAVAFAIAGVICVVLLRSKPSDVGQYPDGLLPEEAQRAREAALAGRASGHRAIARTYRTPVNWAVRDAMRTRAVWLALVGWVGMIMPFAFFITSGHALLYFRGIGFSPMEAALTVSIFNLVNSPGRFIMGWLTDRIEARIIYAVGQVFIVAAIVIAWVIPAGDMFLLYTYSVLWGVGFGLTYPVMAPWMGNYYGAANFAPINGSTILPIGSIFSGFVPIGAGYIFDALKSYTLAFGVLLVVAVVGMVGALLATPPRPKEAVAAPRPVS